ncbi:MAG: VOC family protein [Rhizobiaceae bacterium]
MRPAGILESALYVDDLAAAQVFYADVLGLDVIKPADGRQVFLRCGDGVVLIFDATETARPVDAEARFPVPPHGTTGPGHLCFRAGAEEIEAWKTRLEGHGIVIEADFTWPSGGRSIYFRDPAGNSIEFAEPNIWGIA